MNFRSRVTAGSVPATSKRFAAWMGLPALGLCMLGANEPIAQVSQEANDGRSPIPEITVIERRISAGYRARESQVGLGFDVDTLRLPQSVNVITAEMLADQKPMTLSDAVRNTSGVGAARNSVEPFNSFKLRGFDVSESITDGIRNTNALNIQAGGLANLERIEVLRGPGGAVYGLSSPGGVINLVSKRPLPEQRFAGAVSVGSFDHRQIEADLSGPLSANGSLGYRLVGQYEDRDSFVDFVGVESWQIAPTLQWTHDSGTTLRYHGDWRRREGLRYISLPLQGTLVETGDLDLKRSLFTGEPGQGDTVTKSQIHTLILEREGEGRNLSRLYGRLTSTDFDQPSVAPVAVLDDGRTLTRRFNQFIEDQEERVIGGLVVREFSAFGMQHAVAAGTDYAEWTYDSEFIRGAVGPLDLLNPVYGSPIDILFVLAESRDEFEQMGGYLQNYITVGDNVNVLLGVRWDRLVNRTEDLRFNTSGKSTDKQWSPRLGLSWEPLPGVAPYLSYSRTFIAGPSFGFVRSPDGSPFGPQRGSQWEAGVKFDFFDNLSSGIAVFEIEQSNVPTVDPEDPFFRVPTGKQRSRGIEWSGTWEPGEGLGLLWSYAYIDAEVTRDNVIPSGSRLDNVPKHTGRLWARYAKPIGGDWTAGLTAGVLRSSAAPIGIGSPLDVSSFTVLEGGAFVSRGSLIAEVKVDNLTDRDYLLRGAFGGAGVVPGDARRVIFSLGWRP